jgi:hypothetical protein
MSPIKVMIYLEHIVDICDTPLNELINIVQSNSAFEGVDVELLRKKILKQKSILKRNRAKNRKFISRQPKPVIELPIVGTEH